jgi:hypothetical protein
LIDQFPPRVQQSGFLVGIIWMFPDWFCMFSLRITGSPVHVLMARAMTCWTMSAGDWKRMADFDKMLIMRVLRADRLMSAMSRFVSGVLGPEFVTSQAFDLERSYQVCLPYCSSALHVVTNTHAAGSPLAAALGGT